MDRAWIKATNAQVQHAETSSENFLYSLRFLNVSVLSRRITL